MRFFEISKFLKNVENFQKHDFSIFKGISIIFEKSCFRKFSIFSKFSKFRENFKNFRNSTLTNFNFRSTQRIFLIFFYGSKWIFEADRTSLSEIASESTGKSYFTFTKILTPNSRFYIKTRISLSSFVKQHFRQTEPTSVLEV